MIRGLSGLLLAAACAAAAAQGSDTVYRTVGPDGRVTYSQVPPAGTTPARKLEFEKLPASPLPAYLLKFRDDMARGSAAAAAAPAGLRLFSAKWCGYCKQARAWLSGQGVAFEEVDIDQPAGMAAFAQAGGRGSVPLLVGSGVRLQGFSPDSYAAAVAPKRRP